MPGLNAGSEVFTEFMDVVKRSLIKKAGVIRIKSQDRSHG